MNIVNGYLNYKVCVLIWDILNWFCDIVGIGTVSGLVLWHSGLVLWHSGLVLWHSGLVLWHSGLVLWHSGLVLWHSGLILWHSGLVLWHSGLVLWHSGLVLWHSGLVLWHSGLVLWFSELIRWHAGLVMRGSDYPSCSRWISSYFCTHHHTIVTDGVINHKLSNDHSSCLSLWSIVAFQF